jgi:hypothetical protein
MIYILITNLCNAPNLLFLSIINDNISFHIETIISKCILLKKLHTLFLYDQRNCQIELNEIELYYDTYPELKKTNIKFCSLPEKNKNKK